HGQFVVQTAADIEVQHPEESNFSLALSLIHPGPGEFNPIGRNSSYGITNRMGWITAGYGRPLRRQAVRMVEEGSVLEGWRGKGDLVRVLDKNSVSGMPHSVYRYGNAFTLPIRIGKRRTHA
ncbi:MAG: hypothetical protein ACE5D1_04785, partial [Fidelibacterota bacterium]